MRGASPAEDYRNGPNTHGWVVEVDPFCDCGEPRKRTALGRLAHEGAGLGPVQAGKPLAWYMGDDSRGEYVYKFVSAKSWDPADVNGGYEAGSSSPREPPPQALTEPYVNLSIHTALLTPHPALSSTRTPSAQTTADHVVANA